MPPNPIFFRRPFLAKMGGHSTPGDPGRVLNIKKEGVICPCSLCGIIFLRVFAKLENLINFHVRFYGILNFSHAKILEKGVTPTPGGAPAQDFFMLNSRHLCP